MAKHSIKLSGAFNAKVAFANFAIEHNISPKKLAELCTLVERRARHTVRASQHQIPWAPDEAKDERLMQEIRGLAALAGFDGVEFNSSYATFLRNGRAVYLPLP